MTTGKTIILIQELSLDCSEKKKKISPEGIFSQILLRK